MGASDKRIAWDAVDWENTHLEFQGDPRSDPVHIGTIETEDGEKIVLRVGSDSDDQPFGVVILGRSDVEDLAAQLRVSARTF